jgi:tRNA(His) 5'-end guanylyltransferase
MNLHERMKQYEAVSQTYLMRRTPVIIRLDGVAFHTFTKDFIKPCDDVFAAAMHCTTSWLVNNIQGCVLGYTQSDEISLILQDYKKLDTDAWFGYNIQKLVSVSAKMATSEFNRAFNRLIALLPDNATDRYRKSLFPDNVTDRYRKALMENVGFDSRCFNLPFEEVNNYLIDRQQDAERNSINLLAQQYYSQKELDGIKSNELQNKLFTEKGVNWNHLVYYQKRGFVALPNNDPNPKDILDGTPIFSKEPEFVNSRIRFDKEDDENEH